MCGWSLWDRLMLWSREWEVEGDCWVLFLRGAYITGRRSPWPAQREGIGLSVNVAKMWEYIILCKKVDFHVAGGHCRHPLIEYVTSTHMQPQNNFFFEGGAIPVACGSSQARGWISCRPTHQFPSLSATPTAALGIAGSLTHGVRTGMEPASSWILVGFVSAEPHRNFTSAQMFSVAF